MGLQKYRADKRGETQGNGATPYYTLWMGGPSLALIRDCPTPWGARTVYIRAEADTFFSIPAACTVRGVTVRGYIASEAGEYVFVPYTEEAARVVIGSRDSYRRKSPATDSV